MCIIFSICGAFLLKQNTSQRYTYPARGTYTTCFFNVGGLGVPPVPFALHSLPPAASPGQNWQDERSGNM